mgnify:CR=1 FL=1
MHPTQIALQLYTVRSLTAADMAGALEQVADAGYVAVEFAGYGSSPRCRCSAAPRSLCRGCRRNCG